MLPIVIYHKTADSTGRNAIPFRYFHTCRGGSGNWHFKRGAVWTLSWDDLSLGWRLHWEDCSSNSQKWMISRWISQRSVLLLKCCLIPTLIMSEIFIPNRNRGFSILVMRMWTSFTFYCKFVSRAGGQQSKSCLCQVACVLLCCLHYKHPNLSAEACTKSDLFSAERLLDLMLHKITSLCSLSISAIVTVSLAEKIIRRIKPTHCLSGLCKPTLMAPLTWKRNLNWVHLTSLTPCVLNCIPTQLPGRCVPPLSTAVAGFGSVSGQQNG